MAAHAILLSLQGVPGIYIHSLLGSENYWEGYASSGIKRRINRQKLERAQLERELADPASLRSLVFTGFGKLLKTRRSQPAFHPNAPSASWIWAPNYSRCSGAKDQKPSSA